MRKGTITKAEVYRFNDLVAINLVVAGGEARTVYLSADMAELLAGLTQDCSDDIRACSFTKSHLTPYSAEVVCDQAQLRKS